MEDKLIYYLTPIFRVALFILFSFLCAIPFGLIAEWNFLPPIANELFKELLLQASLVLIVVSALLMVFKVMPSLDFYTVFIKKKGALGGFLKGSLIGLLIMLLCVAILYVNGNVSFSANHIPLGVFILYLFYFILIAIFEEFFFRTYPLYALVERFPVWYVIILNGMLFGLAHLGNPDVTILGIFNICLAGMLFSIYTLQKQNISWAVGIHFGWNFTQGILLGYKVSGNDLPGVMKAKPLGVEYFSGGNFGVEGSIFCTFILIVLIAWLVFNYKFEALQTYRYPYLEEEKQED